MIAIKYNELYTSYQISNYGRIVEKDSKVFRKPGIKLTDEVIDYIKIILSSGLHMVDNARKLIDKYNEKYAFAANDVHSKKIEAIRSEIKCELADEFAKMAEERAKLDEITEHNRIQTQLNAAQANMIKREREEFNRILQLDKDKRKSEKEVDTSMKQIKYIKRQLAKEVADQRISAIALKKENDRLVQFHKELVERAKMLDFVEAGSDYDTSD